jgi:hypothetical protein
MMLIEKLDDIVTVTRSASLMESKSFYKGFVSVKLNLRPYEQPQYCVHL